MTLPVLAEVAADIPASLAPLCVDLDGTLVRTDLLHEASIAYVSRRPWRSWQLLIWAAQGKDRLKTELAERVEIEPGTLPYRADLLDHIATHRAAGGATYLVTASPLRWARGIADHLGLFDGVSASGDGINLKGQAKADHLIGKFGLRGFHYVGDSVHDRAVWGAAGRQLGAGPRAARLLSSDATIFPEGSSRTGALLRAMRLHQWIKNLLLFIPLVAAHRTDSASVMAALLAFAAFCCCASSGYLINDMVDIPSDRRHPRKSRRPFASGDLPIWVGIGAAPALLVIAGLLCLALPPLFAASLLVYYLVTQAYSVTLKRRAPADIFTLAALYTIRVVAGGFAVGVPLSLWLLAFSMLLFLSLATLKRHAELLDAAQRGKDSAAGRGYWTGDGMVLVGMGMASGFSAVLVFSLYVAQPHVAALYRTPPLLWLISPLLLYWISRMWLLAQRLQMHDDPVVLALRDPISRNIMFGCAAIAIAAFALRLPIAMMNP